MTQMQINDAINNAFANLADLNASLYDYWLSELYDEEGDLIVDAWNEVTLNLMETDVMMQQQATESC
jgi:DNA-binding transcriptional regulator YbjK